MGHPADASTIPELFPDGSLFPDELDPPEPGTEISAFTDSDLSPEEHAFEEVAMALGLSEEVIDDLPGEELAYYSALVGAVAVCNVGRPEGYMTVMTVTNIQELHTIASAQEDRAVAFLHVFAIEAEAGKKSIRKAVRDAGEELDATAFYNQALWRYIRRRPGSVAQAQEGRS